MDKVIIPKPPVGAVSLWNVTGDVMDERFCSKEKLEEFREEIKECERLLTDSTNNDTKNNQSELGNCLRKK